LQSMQMEQQHKLKLAALHEEKEAQVQHCQELKRDLQQQLLYIQQVITKLSDKEACLEGKYQDVVQELTAHHAAVLHSSPVHAGRNWQV